MIGHRGQLTADVYYDGVRATYMIGGPGKASDLRCGR
jgi:hypothetical protein